jgi:hypothetical protein
MARSVHVTGLDKVTSNMTGVQAMAKRRGKSVVRVEAEKVMLQAKRLAPVDDGVLQASGRVHPAELEGTKVTVRLTFGGDAKDYAIPVHERLDVRHTNGQAKFLETPVLAHSKVFAENVARTLRLLLNGGT